MSFQDRAEAIVEINGAQADQEMNTLTQRSKYLNDQFTKMREEKDVAGMQKLNKDIIAVEKQMQQIKSETFSVTNTLKNLNGVSLKDLERSKKILVGELSKMTAGTDDFIRKSKSLELVTSRISDVKQQMYGVNKSTTESGATFSSAFGKVAGVFTGITAGAAAVWGSMQFGISVMRSTGDGADKLEATVGGLKSAFEQLKRVIATMDFSNFFENLDKAYKSGKDYVESLDNIADKKRGLGYIEANYKKELIEQERILKDATASEEDRVKAGKRIQEIWAEIGKERTGTTKQAYETELQYTADITGLTKEQVQAYQQNFLALQDNINAGKRYNELKKEEPALLAGIRAEEAKRNLALGYWKNQLAKGAITQLEYDEKISQMNQTLTGEDAKKIAELEKLSNTRFKDGTTVQYWANVVTKSGIAVDAQYDKLLQTYNEYTDAQISGEENTKKAYTTTQSLLKQIADEKEKQTEEEIKNAKKKTEELAKEEKKQLDDAIKAETDRVKRKKTINELSMTPEQKQQQADYDTVNAAFGEGFETADEVDKYAAAISAIDEKWKKYALDKEAEFQKKKRDIKESLGLFSDQELMQIELDDLKTAYDEKLLSEEDYQAAQDKIKDKYRDLAAEKDEEAYQKKLDKIKDEIAAMQTFISAFSDFYAAEKEGETIAVDNEYKKQQKALDKKYKQDLAAAGNDNKKKEAVEAKYNKNKEALAEENEQNQLEISKRYADKEFALKVASIIASTALGAISAFTGMVSTIPGPVGMVLGAIAAAAVVATGVVQVNNAKQQRDAVKQLAKGKYDVIGMDDGRNYDNVPMIPRANTGIYSSPVLIAEAGPELVVDSRTLRNIQLNHPEVLAGIRRAYVPQMAEGNVSTTIPDTTTSSPASETLNSQMLSVLVNIFNAVSRDTRAYVVLTDIEQAQADKQEVLDAATK